jgi:mitotic-spindle organizing protein 1
MSQVLGCGIDRKSMLILIQLLEAGVNPEALAAVVKEMKRERDAMAL